MDNLVDVVCREIWMRRQMPDPIDVRQDVKDLVTDVLEVLASVSWSARCEAEICKTKWSEFYDHDD